MLSFYAKIFRIPFLLIAVSVNAQPANALLHSRWDEDLLNIKLQVVRVNADNMEAAWQEIGAKYLLRANLYVAANSDSDATKFAFTGKDITGKDLLDAFVATYPAYTYTQDKETGIIWLHPKNTSYINILGQEVTVEHPVEQVPMLSGIVNPLCLLLTPIVNTSSDNFGPPMDMTYDYCVDLAAGNYTVVEALNYCCVWNITKSFIVAPDSVGKLIIQPINLYSDNPLAPRQAAVRFWEVEIGKPTNSIPSIEELSGAMGDANPRIRWAARNYFEATSANYPWGILIEKSASPKKAVWTALGVKSVLCRGVNDDQFISHLGSRFTTNLTQIKDPSLALVTSLELTREKQNTSYLDSIVGKHKFSQAEIDSIKPDVYRLAHESKLVLDKLKAMNLNVPEFSAEALRELEKTNIFTLVPSGKN
jgi:hypothetical protein